MCVRIISNRRRRGVLFAARIWRSATQKDMAGQDKLFFLAAFSNDSGCLREHFKVCFLYRENLTKEKWNRSVHQSQNLKEKVEMKRSPVAVLISLSREGLICSVTRALRRDKMYLAQNAHQKDEGGSGWVEKREMSFLFSRLTIQVFLRKFYLFYRTICIKRPDTEQDRKTFSRKHWF